MTTEAVSRVMREVRNWFAVAAAEGTWSVSGGHVYPGVALQPGDWVALSGINAVRQVDENGRLPIENGEYACTLYLLRPPEEFLGLCRRIDAWLAAHPDAGTRSERFGPYSRTMASGRGGGPVSWPAVFGRELAPYRRMYAEVDLG